MSFAFSPTPPPLLSLLSHHPLQLPLHPLQPCPAWMKKEEEERGHLPLPLSTLSPITTIMSGSSSSTRRWTASYPHSVSTR